MLIAPTFRRTLLNRSHPLVRGRVTWLPFDGHLANMGDRGGRFPMLAGTTFGSSGNMGLLPGGATGTTALAATAAQLGITGAAPRTTFLSYYHGNTATAVPFYATGTSATRQEWSIRKADATGLICSCYYDQVATAVHTGNGDWDVLAVVTYDGATTIRIMAKAVKVTTTNAVPVGRSS